MDSEHYRCALSIASTLKNAGHLTYFVGGWVRDYVLKEPSNDIDIGTTASPDQVVALFEKTIPVGISFGVVIVVIDGHQFEVASFRQEAAYEDGRRPTSITLSTPKHDAKRRDFTINGLFFDPIEQQIIDYVDGRHDLKAGIVRAIGKAEDRFLEDRLRMIRAIRYTARFDFKLEESTKKAIKKHASELFPSVSIERVAAELSKMKEHSGFDKALLLMHEVGLLASVFPSTKTLSKKDLEKRVSIFKRYPKETPLPLYLFHLLDINDEQAMIALVKRFKLPNKMVQLASFYHRSHKLLKAPISKADDATWAGLYASEWFSICMQTTAAHTTEEKAHLLNQIHQEKQVALRTAIERAKNHTTLITAHDLTKEGISPSPLMGQLLKEGEVLAINHGIDDHKVALERLKKSKLWPKKN